MSEQKNAAASSTPSPYDDISRVSRSKESAAENYTKMSGWYDMMTAGSERQFTDVGLRQLNAQPGENVLEIGFGTGYAIVKLAKAVGTIGSVKGIDIADGMVQVTMKRVKKELPTTIESQVELTCGDATTLPFPTASFDAVFMSFVIELFDTPDIPGVVDEVVRVLKPGGRITVVALAKLKQFSVSVYEWFHKVMPTMVDCRPVKPVQILQSTAGLQIDRISMQEMWGLPVEVVTAVATAAPLPRFPSAILRGNGAWVADKDARRCAVCDVKFHFFRRRHHCRCCGAVVCGSCSGQTLVLTVDVTQEAALRACNRCVGWTPLPPLSSKQFSSLMKMREPEIKIERPSEVVDTKTPRDDEELPSRSEKEDGEEKQREEQQENRAVNRPLRFEEDEEQKEQKEEVKKSKEAERAREAGK